MKTIPFPLRVDPKAAVLFRLRATDNNMSQGDYLKHLLALDGMPNVYPAIMTKISNLVTNDPNTKNIPNMEFFKHAEGMSELVNDIKLNYNVSGVLTNLESTMNKLIKTIYNASMSKFPVETIIIANMVWLSEQLNGA